MNMHIPFKLSPQQQAIKLILEKISEIGYDLSPSDLEWSIKMENAFDTYGTLTQKQLNVLINILERHAEKEDEDEPPENRWEK
jgi:hypothetical protein